MKKKAKKYSSSGLKLTLAFTAGLIVSIVCSNSLSAVALTSVNRAMVIYTPTRVLTIMPSPTLPPLPTASPTPNPTPLPSMAWGVNLAGLNFGDSAFQPGGIGWQTTYGDWYIKPTAEELDYFASKGMGLFRLSFRWERLQHYLNADLNPVDMGYIDDVVNEVAARGLKVYIEPHNYGRYFDLITNQTLIIGSSKLPYDAFADLWRKLAEHYKDNPAVWGYDLMNEPYSMAIGEPGAPDYLAGNENWKQAVQAAINAIREVDTETTIIVPGYFWSSAVMWPSTSDNLKDLVDPANNLIYEAHQYLDADGSGAYGSDSASINLTTGYSRLKPFVDWLRANGKKGLIGEIGIPSDQNWLDTLKPALDYIVANRDVLVSVQFYAAGPWYAEVNYPLCLDPTIDADGNYIDKPQMTLLSIYILHGN